MFGIFKNVLKSKSSIVSEMEQRYLNESTDRIDLEYRMKQIDRGLFRNSKYGF